MSSCWPVNKVILEIKNNPAKVPESLKKVVPYRTAVILIRLD